MNPHHKDKDCPVIGCPSCQKREDSPDIRAEKGEPMEWWIIYRENVQEIGHTRVVDYMQRGFIPDVEDVHVIEYSAYDAVKAERESLKKLINLKAIACKFLISPQNMTEDETKTLLEALFGKPTDRREIDEILRGK